MKKLLVRFGFGSIFAFAMFFSFSIHQESTDSGPTLSLINAEALADKPLYKGSTLCIELIGDVCMTCIGIDEDYNENGPVCP